MNKTMLELNLHNMPRFIASHVKRRREVRLNEVELWNDLRDMRDTLTAAAQKRFAKDVKQIEAGLLKIFKKHNPESGFSDDGARGIFVSYIMWLEGKISDRPKAKHGLIRLEHHAMMPGPTHEDYREARKLALEYQYYRIKHFDSDIIKKVIKMENDLAD